LRRFPHKINPPIIIIFYADSEGAYQNSNLWGLEGAREMAKHWQPAAGASVWNAAMLLGRDPTRENLLFVSD
jgi:hypothetical protein